MEGFVQRQAQQDKAAHKGKAQAVIVPETGARNPTFTGDAACSCIRGSEAETAILEARLDMHMSHSL